MIVYGMAFDFFNISGSLFVELETKPETRASAQGLFFIMTNGLGAVIGGYASGAVVDAFSVYETECWQVATGRLSGSYLQHMHWLSVFCLQLFSDTNINRENLRK